MKPVHRYVAVYSQDLSVILTNSEELMQMCHRSDEAHARDRNQVMEVASQHVSAERAVAHWCEMYQELGEQGDAYMLALTDGKSIALGQNRCSRRSKSGVTIWVFLVGSSATDRRMGWCGAGWAGGAGGVRGAWGDA